MGEERTDAGAGGAVYFVPPLIGTGRTAAFRMVSEAHPHERGFLFALDEYGEAFRAMFEVALESLVQEKSTLLRSIRTETVDHVPNSHVTSPSGEVVSNPPVATSLPYCFDRRGVVDFNLAAFALACDQLSELLTDARVNAVLDFTHRITDAFGNVAHAEGQPFGWPVIIKGLSRISIDFDAHGSPELPLIVLERDKRNVVPYPPMSASDKAAFDDLMSLKKREFDARRRNRQLR